MTDPTAPRIEPPEDTIEAIAADLESSLGVKVLRAIAEVMLAGFIGLALIMLGLGGGAWILGGVAAGALVFYGDRTWFHRPALPNKTLRKMGQVLIGLAIGFSIRQSTLSSLSSQIPVLVLLGMTLLVSGGVIGYFYSRLEKVDLLTGVLATTPGNIGVMASIAADYSKNTAFVSLVQLLRFTTIIAVIPLVAQVPHTTDLRSTLSALLPDAYWLTLGNGLELAAVLAAAALAAQLGTRLNIPVATFFCPILVGLGFAPLGFADWFADWFAGLPSGADASFNLPPLLKVVGQILLGTTIGEYWANSPRITFGTLARAIIPVTLTFSAGLLTAAIAKALTPWDWLTCLLIAAPGGSPEMIWIALSLQHDVELVTASHLVRLLVINLSLPGLIWLASYIDSRLAAQQGIVVHTEQ
ncbi:AbrB family transcriptional regulator [Thermoleptolyngbya oregonensis NK1-22]|uniref:AbrB family transcriptional regulator n=1 Tax=Thermoleptolyngbya oregonensis NK1-22 TaxID=2547457 RepID=A0AA97BDB4_9CYAN|nr:AbrB family transcriptional regulator [Thermoleptolyngbya oregonensis]WOB43991.1 AbrB family transcriptional regulator [Thermoleptolyngbya oregonensis NK1-22]